MNQEDKDLQELLRKFNPKPGGEVDFMARLQNRMDSVDVVKEQITIERRRNRRAVILAALCGCLVGVLFALALPLILTSIRPLFIFSLAALMTVGCTLGAYYLFQILVFSTKKRKFAAENGTSL